MELLVDWIPIVGQVFSFIIDLIAVTVFAIWFLIAGAKLTNPRTAARFWITNLAELLPIPVIDFCLTTVGVILTIREVWREDVQEAEEKRAKEKQSAAMMAELQKRGGAQK